MRKPKPNVVISFRGLTAKRLEKRLNDLEARNYHRGLTIETEGLMVFYYFEPQPVRDQAKAMEHIGKISRQYLAWHKTQGLGKRASEGQVEYFVRNNHLAFPEGSPLTATDLRLIRTNVNLILGEKQ